VRYSRALRPLPALASNLQFRHIDSQHIDFQQGDFQHSNFQRSHFSTHERPSLCVLRRASRPAHKQDTPVFSICAIRPDVHPTTVTQRRSPDKEWIFFSFLSYRCSLAVAGNYYGVVRECQNTVVQRAHDFFVGASWEIRASDATGKQSIAGNQ